MRLNARAVQLACLLTLLITGPVMADDLGLPGFDAEYVLKKGGFRVAQAQVQLEKKDGIYAYSSSTQPVGFLSVFRKDRIKEQSVFRVHEGRIRPLSYTYLHDTGSKKRRDVELEFRWDANQVANTVAGNTWTMSIPEGTLDKFSLQLAVTRDLQQGKRDLRYKVADGGKLKEYRFAIQGAETVKLPIGSFEAVKLERLRDKDADRQTFFWCAPALDYLLVRVAHVEEGAGPSFTMELENVSAN